MAALSPAPSTMRKLSLVTFDGLRRAEHVDGRVGERHAEVLVDDLGAGDHGDVLENALAAIAEAGALTATTLSVPRILLSRRDASASPSTSSATSSSGRRSA